MPSVSCGWQLLLLVVVLGALFNTSHAFAPSRYSSISSFLSTKSRHYRTNSNLNKPTSQSHRGGLLVLRAIDVKEGNLVEFTSKNGEVILGIRRILGLQRSTSWLCAVNSILKPRKKI